MLLCTDSQVVCLFSPFQCIKKSNTTPALRSYWLEHLLTSARNKPIKWQENFLRWKRELPKAYEHVTSDLRTHTLVILLRILAKYFSCVRESSSCPPAMARMMASAMRLSCRHRSTALSKFPVSRACVISPSTSAKRQGCTSKCCHKSHWEMQQQVTLPDCTMLVQLSAIQPAPGQVLTGVLTFTSSFKHTWAQPCHRGTVKHYLPCDRASF